MYSLITPLVTSTMATTFLTPHSSGKSVTNLLDLFLICYEKEDRFQDNALSTFALKQFFNFANKENNAILPCPCPVSNIKNHLEVRSQIL